jgi:hypothetical protein
LRQCGNDRLVIFARHGGFQPLPGADQEKEDCKMILSGTVAKVRLIALTLVASLLATADAAAQVVDLVGHNGFEACWSNAITKTTFLDLIQATIDDKTFCVPQVSGSASGYTYDACNTAACPGNVVGCPVTTHAGSFSGDFVTGDFSSTGTADDVSVPISYNGLSSGSCTILFSNIMLDYAPSYFLTADGNNGDYMAYLTQSSVTVTNSDASVNLPANLTCTPLLNFFKGVIIDQAQTAASNNWAPLLSADTVGESVCPLTP